MPNSGKNPKNIVICCDGTGNKFGASNSNVVRLYTCLVVNEEQVAYYHPGVGTMGDPRQTSWVGKQVSQIAGLACGVGFRDNIADAYQFLMEKYSDGDRIFLFGFSRGAYTIRALAGALYMYGLLCPGNEGHLPYLLQMFSTESRRAYRKTGTKQLQVDSTSEAFRETFSRAVPIHFIGLWDTVSSIGWIYDPVKLLYDGQNPIMRKGRHAVSVDERRCFFQANLWGPPLPPNETRLLEHCAAGEGRFQDILQVWFAGVHSDVGGSYAQSESGPAIDAFKWILEEAESDGLTINDEKRQAVLGGASSKHAVIAAMNRSAYPHMNCLHNSLTWKWWPMEAFPHKYFDENNTKRWRITPWPHSREIPDGTLIHPSLRDRLSADANYKPKNLNANNIKDFNQMPAFLFPPSVAAELKKQNYGVYRCDSQASDSLPRPMRTMADIIGGLTTFLLNKK